MRFQFGISRFEKYPDVTEGAERNEPTEKSGYGEAGAVTDIEKSLWAGLNSNDKEN